MKTNKLMKTCCVLAGATTLMLSPSAFATLTGTLTYHGYDTAYGNDPGGKGGALKIQTSNLGDFDSFCLEENESISGLPNTYNYAVNSGAVLGGNSTAPTGTATFDPICIGTAWIYSQFRAGNTFGLAQTDVGYAVQQAIWYLESEIASAYGLGNSVLTSVSSFFGESISTIKATDANGAYGVVALNVTDPTDTRNPYRQDLLAIVPEPSTIVAGALLLFPFGISTVRVLRKSKA